VTGEQDWIRGYRKRMERSAKTLQGRALICIDRILSENEDDDPLLDQLYRIAHCASGVCSNPHADWVAEVNETYEGIE